MAPIKQPAAPPRIPPTHGDIGPPDIAASWFCRSTFDFNDPEFAYSFRWREIVVAFKEMAEVF